MDSMTEPDVPYNKSMWTTRCCWCPVCDGSVTAGIQFFFFAPMTIDKQNSQHGGELCLCLIHWYDIVHFFKISTPITSYRVHIVGFYVQSRWPHLLFFCPDQLIRCNRMHMAPCFGHLRCIIRFTSSASTFSWNLNDRSKTVGKRCANDPFAHKLYIVCRHLPLEYKVPYLGRVWEWPLWLQLIQQFIFSWPSIVSWLLEVILSLIISHSLREKYSLSANCM